MEKIKRFTDWLGEKLFPDLPEKKRQRIAAQIIVGISLLPPGAHTTRQPSLWGSAVLLHPACPSGRTAMGDRRK